MASMKTQDAYSTYVKAAAVKKKAAIPLPVRPTYILPYNLHSRSAKALAKGLGVYRSFNNLAGLEPIRAIDIINWGHGKPDCPFPTATGSRTLNKATAVNLCRNKLKLFKHFKSKEDGPRIPEFFDVLDDAIKARDGGNIVLGRKTTGSCGTDIVTFEEDIGRFNASDFWVVYKKKKAEYRLHIFKEDGELKIIDRQQKVLREVDPVTEQPIDRSKVNFMIRNHRNGFVFKRHDLAVPADVEAQALKAVKYSGLDFGAVDIIWNEHEGKAYVLEINTAPGLEGTTLDNYIAAFKRLKLGDPEVAKEAIEREATETAQMSLYGGVSPFASPTSSW
jgi:hypothetical protein